MADIKTKPTAVKVKDFLNKVQSDQRRADAFEVLKMMQKITGEPSVMWGPSIVGFGKYHYKYDSGREGDMPIVAFSPRKQALTIYVYADEGRDTLLKSLGKHKSTKACIYISKLSDVDKEVLGKIIKKSMEYVQRSISEFTK